MKSKSDVTLGDVGFILFFWALIITTLAMWTERNMDFWCSHISGHPVHVPFFLDWLLSVLSPFVLLANVIGEIARHCI